MNETLKRTISGVIYIALLIGSVYYSQKTCFLLFGVFLLIAVQEFSKLMKINTIVSILTALSIYFLFYYFNVGNLFEIIFVILTVLILIKCIFFLFDDQNNGAGIQQYLYLFGYVIFPFVILNKLPLVNGVYNPKIIISIFILIWTNDTFAYIVGKSIGKTKLLERISPKKTVEGFVGGLLFSILASVLISKYYVDSSLGLWIAVSIIIVFCSTIGDLVESKFKRVAGVKDSGKIMPGHGGILDRFDSVLFVAPFIYLFFKIFNYV